MLEHMFLDILIVVRDKGLIAEGTDGGRRSSELVVDLEVRQDNADQRGAAVPSAGSPRFHNSIVGGGPAEPGHQVVPIVGMLMDPTSGLVAVNGVGHVPVRQVLLEGWIIAPRREEGAIGTDPRL